MAARALRNRPPPRSVRQRTASRRRDHARERALLDHGQRLARITVASWPAHVTARLEHGQDRYGDQWAERPAGDLVAEAVEEAVDLAAWSCLALQSIDADARAGVEETLARACAAAAEAYAWLVAAEETTPEGARP